MGQIEAKQLVDVQVTPHSDHKNSFDLLSYLDAKSDLIHDFVPRKLSKSLTYANPDVGLVPISKPKSPDLLIREDSETDSNNTDINDAVTPKNQPRRESITRFQSPFLFQRSMSCEPFVNPQRMPDDLRFEMSPEGHKFHTPNTSQSGLDIDNPYSHRLEHLEPFIRRRSNSGSSEKNVQADREAVLNRFATKLNSSSPKMMRNSDIKLMSPITEVQVFPNS